MDGATAKNGNPRFRIWPENWLWPMDWAKHFDQPRPLEVDVGCGKGRFLLARAAQHPETNFLGIDRMLRRIRKIDNRLQREGLTHVRLLRAEAYYACTYLLPPRSVSVFYVFHPDPWPKARHAEHRLFNPAFMDAVSRTLLPGGRIHLSTDHAPYFEEIDALLAADTRFSRVEPFVPEPHERTDFEQYYLEHGEVHRCSFALNA